MLGASMGLAIAGAFAIGALGVDAFAFFIAPLFGIEANEIEYEPYSPSIPNGQVHKSTNKIP